MRRGKSNYVTLLMQKYCKSTRQSSFSHYFVYQCKSFLCRLYYTAVINNNKKFRALCALAPKIRFIRRPKKIK